MTTLERYVESIREDIADRRRARRQEMAIVVGIVVPLVLALAACVHGAATQGRETTDEFQVTSKGLPNDFQVGCLTRPPPDRAHFSTIREGCPSGFVCYDPANVSALLDELEARRNYDDVAWRECGRDIDK